MNVNTGFNERRRDIPPLKAAFMRARKAETQFAIRLRKIASHIGDIVRGFDVETQDGWAQMNAALNKYAQLIEPWARAVSTRMIAEVAARDKQTWREVSATIGRSLHHEIEYAPVGTAMQRLLDDQVGLIKSLPLEAAQRVHNLTTEGITQGTRAKEIASEVMRTGEVTKARATLIARTEVGRTATALTQARAQFVGSTQFIWRTVGDSDVRLWHRRLNGRAFQWDDPPECDPGYHALPGSIFNCRCYAEPIIPG